MQTKQDKNTPLPFLKLLSRLGLPTAIRKHTDMDVGLGAAAPRADELICA